MKENENYIIEEYKDQYDRNCLIKVCKKYRVLSFSDGIHDHNFNEDLGLSGNFLESLVGDTSNMGSRNKQRFVEMRKKLMMKGFCDGFSKCRLAEFTKAYIFGYEQGANCRSTIIEQDGISRRH